MSTLLSRAKEVKSADKSENIDIASKISRHRQKQYHIEPHNEHQPPPIFDETVGAASRFPLKKSNQSLPQQNVSDGKSSGVSQRNSIETIALVNAQPEKPPAYSELKEQSAPLKHSVDPVEPPHPESEAAHSEPVDVNPSRKEVKAASVQAPSSEQIKSNTIAVVDTVVEQLPAKPIDNLDLSTEKPHPFKEPEPVTSKKEHNLPVKNAQPPSGERGKTHFGLGKLWKKSGSQKSTRSSDSTQHKIPEPVLLSEKQPEKFPLTNATEKASKNKQKQKVTSHKRTLASATKPVIQAQSNQEYEDTFMIFNFYEVLQPPPMFTNFKDGFMHFMRTAVQHPQFVEGYLLKDGTSKGKFPYFHYAEFDINGRTFQHDPKWVRAIIEGYGNLQVHHQAGFSYQFSYKAEIPNWSLKDIPNIKERAACLVTVFKAEGNFDRLDSTWQKWSGADFIHHHLPREAMIGKMVLYKRCVPHGTFTYVFVCELVNGLKFYNALLDLVERLNERSCGYSSLYFIDEMF